VAIGGYYINGYFIFSIGGYWLFHLWLLVAILMVTVTILLMVIGDYSINGYW